MLQPPSVQTQWLWARAGDGHKRALVEVLNVSEACFYLLKGITYFEANVMVGLIGDGFGGAAVAAIYVSSEFAL